MQEKGGTAMTEDRLDIITVTDEEGNELLLTVEQYFYYNGQEYVHLRLLPDESHPGDGDDDYVMLVQTAQDEEGEDVEDFLPIDRELMDSLLQVIRAKHQPMPEG